VCLSVDSAVVERSDGEAPAPAGRLGQVG